MRNVQHTNYNIYVYICFVVTGKMIQQFMFNVLSTLIKQRVQPRSPHCDPAPPCVRVPYEQQLYVFEFETYC